MDESTFLNPARALRAAKMHEGMRVADFAAGSGFFTRAAARETGDQGVVWAVDIARDLLPRIKNLASAEGLQNVEVIHGDVGVVGGSNLPDASFDFCVVANILFCIDDKHELVAEVRRVLKQSGRALVIDWSDSFGGLGPHQDHVITKHEAEKLFTSEGFVVVGDIPAGAYHWGFLVRKTKQ